MSAPTADSVRSEVRAWLADNWDETLSVSEWWSRLALSGYAAPTFAVEDFGKGYHRGLANIVSGQSEPE